MHDIVLKIKESSSPLLGSTKRLKKHPLALVGAAIILCLLIVAFFAPLLSPHDPLKPNLPYRLLAPGENYLLGADHMGRCLLSRLIHGARETLRVGLLVVAMTSSIGVFLGAMAGYFGGLIDTIIMRAVDVLLAFPSIILALVMAGILGPSLFSIMLALTIVGWTSYARVVRGAVLSVKEREYVAAIQSLGATDARILLYHILPNVMAPVLVMATLGMAHVILAAAALSFLGLGAQPPLAEWGSMLNAGRPFMRTAPHTTIFPGLAIMITVLAFNFLGDGLRDAFDPYLKESKN